MTLVQKIVALHHAWLQEEVPHAFGGALALAWCTKAARATIDIDVNLFVDVSLASTVLGTLPAGVEWNQAALTELKREMQVRLWWKHTPIDIFLNSTAFHSTVSKRVRWERFAGQELPFLCCSDLAVFKAFFNRTKDWADLEEMGSAGTLDRAAIEQVITRYLGSDDERLHRLRTL